MNKVVMCAVKVYFPAAFALIQQQKCGKCKRPQCNMSVSWL